jgi:NADPH:quinone reductase-like Zn-dependent oxidoreductase
LAVANRFHVELIAEVEVPVPQPQAGQVLVQVRGSSVNPVDHQIIASPLALVWSYPHTVGFDFAGVIVKVGGGVTDLKEGDAVWGQLGTLAEAAEGGGSWAEFVVADASIVGLAPKSLNFSQAGVLPMVSLTGFEAFRFAQALSWRPGTNVTVVVLGGSGGTGHVGIQLARAFGAAKVLARPAVREPIIPGVALSTVCSTVWAPALHAVAPLSEIRALSALGQVITTCGADHIAFVKSLGADIAIDYRTQNWTDLVSDGSVDFVYDTVGAKGTGDQVVPKLKSGGYFVTLEAAGPKRSRTSRQYTSIDAFFSFLT